MHPSLEEIPPYINFPSMSALNRLIDLALKIGTYCVDLVVPSL